MAHALAQRTDVFSAGMMAREVYGKLEPRDDSIGIEHELLLWDRRPEVWHRWHSWRQLRRFYIERARRHGVPDVVLVKNLGPSYNCFVRWLRRQNPRPLIIWLLADSGSLGKKIPLLKRIRYAFKPLVTVDENKAISWFDACISFSLDTRQYFESRALPWFWMPPAPNFHYDPPTAGPALGGPIRFGYFGTLAGHSHVLEMARAFLRAEIPGTLHVCGYGGLAEKLKELAARNPPFHFDGLLPKQSDCLPWAQQVDVLINPRPPAMGLENSFPSKIFEYAMAGRAILSSRTGGVDQVVGPEGFYIENENFEDSLVQNLRQIAAIGRPELQRRGTAIRQRILTDYNWEVQARRVTEFLTDIVAARRQAH
jgi:glycosyltransferase involved in cell wall biosynthesis